MKSHLVLTTVLLGAVAASAEAGFPIAEPGTECLTVVVAVNGPVVATYQGNSASYSNDLYLMLDGGGNPGDDGNTANDLFIFNNHTTPVGTQMNLGSFTAGTELRFRLHVNDTNFDFFTGPADRNPDDDCHARVQSNWTPNETLVSFEDLFDGPFDYNDLSFSFSNTSSCVDNQPPVLSVDVPDGVDCGSTVTLQTGVPFNMVVVGSDSDGSFTIGLGALPPGSSTNVQSTYIEFTWLPTAAGTYTAEFLAVDDCVTTVCGINFNVIANEPPDCSEATASLLSLWPPNHVLVPVAINGVTDPDGDPVTVQVTSVTQDEPTNNTGDGDTCPDAVIDGDGNVSVRSERAGHGNGRVYAINFIASDGQGGACTGTVSVCIPRDKGRNSVCVDDGQDYNSADCTESSVIGAPVSGSAIQVSVTSTSSSARLIQYRLPAEGNVELSAFDVQGRHVAVIETGYKSAGEHQATWDTASIPGGMYFLLLKSGNQTSKTSVVVLK
jgi:hypothetical protein